MAANEHSITITHLDAVRGRKLRFELDTLLVELARFLLFAIEIVLTVVNLLDGRVQLGVLLAQLVATPF